MKNFSFLSTAFFISFAIFLSSAQAATREEFADNHSGNCLVHITTTGLGGNGKETPITSQDDWASHMIVKGDDGYVWKRAVITSHTDHFALEEGEQTRIYGTAPIGSVVQVMFFPYVDNNPNDTIQGVQIPDFIDGSCFQADDFTNDNALFFYTVADQAFWGAIGEKMVFDAFYKTNIPWDTYLSLYQSDTNNILVGSHVLPKILSMGGEMEIPEECQEVCEGFLEGTVLNSAQLPEPFATPKLLDDFDSPVAVIGRSDVHTYNSAFEGAPTNNPQKLRDLTHKALTMEILKRRLLGNRNYGALDDGIQEITVDELKDGAEGRGTGAETQELILAIRAVLTDDDETPPDAAARFLNQAQFLVNAAHHEPMHINADDSIPVLIPPQDPTVVVNPLPHVGIYPHQPPEAATPDFPPDIFTRGDGLFLLEQINAGGGENTIKELFPLQDRNIEGDLPFNDDNWAETFIEILTFWTGRPTTNLCLLHNDRFVASNFEDHGLDGEIGPVCAYPYVSGRTPTLLLYTAAEILVEPNFFNTVITEANSYFTTQNGWQFPAGKKLPLSYEYEFTDSFLPKIEGESCITKEDIPEYTQFLAKKLHLFASETDILKKEISVLFEKENTLFHLFIANPSDISSHILWNGNGKKLDIFQLFFDAKPGECAQKDFGIVDISPPSEDRDGFEAGIFQM